MVRNENGQATVELAFALVIFVLLLFAIVDFGRIFHAYLTLEHAGREGARIASIGATDTEIVNRVKAAAPSLETNNIKFSISPALNNRTSGTYVTIQLTYPIPFSAPILENRSESTLTLKSKTVMRVE